MVFCCLILDFLLYIYGMTPEQRNLILGILAVLIILGIVFYFNKKNELSPLTPPSQEGEDTGESSPFSEGGVPATSEGGGENSSQSAGSITTGTPESGAEQQAAFNATMAKASEAFVKGDYNLAVKYYNDALKIVKIDVAYSGLFNAYTALQNWPKALEAINQAIELKSSHTEYWKAKLTLLDERTGVTYTELKAVYGSGLAKSDGRTKINLVTHFANIAEANGEKEEAIALWEYAKTLNPAKSVVYQTEIDRMD